MSFQNKDIGIFEIPEQINLCMMGVWVGYRAVLDFGE
jgi:hypothetical protein